jgi:uncharacterized membrane protein
MCIKAEEGGVTLPDFKFGYETYQDVRHNLFLYSTPVLIAAGFFAFFGILPPKHQQLVTGFLEALSTAQPWKGMLGAGVGVIAFAGVAYFLTEIVQVHDQWYDKHVIKWRHPYATDFMLPRLIQPWASRINYRIHEVADQNTGDFMERLFYPYVRDRDLKIPKNKVIRFYEVVTIYWLTQINEIVLLALAFLIAGYGYTGPVELGYRTLLFKDLVFIFALFIFNRIWVRASRDKVRRATAEEIRAILDDEELSKDLETKLAKICRDYSLPYVLGD